VGFIIVLVVVVVADVILALIPAVIAQSKGRRFGEWYLYGLLLWIVAIIHSLVIKPTTSSQRLRLASEGYRTCPFCDEMIRPGAVVCRYCGRELSDSDPRDDWNLDADETAERAWRQIEGT
jgi:hypothetical protein